MLGKISRLSFVLIAFSFLACTTDDLGNIEQPEDPPIKDPDNPNAEDTGLYARVRVKGLPYAWQGNMLVRGKGIYYWEA